MKRTILFNRNLITKMESQVFVMCNTEKGIDNFYNKYTECKQCEIKRGLNRYYENKDKISYQQKIYYEKNEKIYYKNKILDIQITKKYLDPMLNYKID